MNDGLEGAIIAWHDDRTGYGETYAQRIENNGTCLWTENGVRIQGGTGFYGWLPDAISDGFNGAIIVWVGYYEDIYAQRVNGNGELLWGTPYYGLPICSDTSSQGGPAVIADNLGGAFIVWVDYRNGKADIYAQHVNANGITSWDTNGVAICVMPGNKSGIRMGSNGQGGVIMAWTDTRNGNSDVYAQRVDINGNVMWAPNGKVICQADSEQLLSDAVSDGHNGAILTWRDTRHDDGDVYAQWIDGEGNKKWQIDGLSVCICDSAQSEGRVVSVGEGEFIIVWVDYRNGHSNPDLYAQKLRTGFSLVSPNGGESWQGESTQDITWTTSGSGIDHIRLLYSTNSGSTYSDTITHSVPDTGSYSWLVPNIDCTTIRVKAQALNLADSILTEDESDGDFEIYTNITITLTSPNGGESWQGGTACYDITWTTTGDNIDHIKLLYSTNSGTSYDFVIEESVPNNGVYHWSVPNINLSTVRVKAQALNSADSIFAEDESDGDFEIYVEEDKNWTVLVFINGDNNLNNVAAGKGSYTKGDIDEIELSGGSNNNVKMIVQIDGDDSNYGSSGGQQYGYDDLDNTGIITCRRYLIETNQQNGRIDAHAIQDIGEANMGDPTTLIDFIKWGIDNYPADHYWVVIWDHGNGWYKKAFPFKGFSYDEHPKDHIGVANGELESALRDIRIHLGKNIDLVSFDACLMAMAEVDHIAQNYADIITHSEKTIPGDGYPYDKILGLLNSNPEMSPKALGNTIVSEYTTSYKPGGSQEQQMISVTHSVIDIAPFFMDTRLFLAINDLALRLMSAGGKGRQEISEARDNTQNYWEGDPNYDFEKGHIDLFDFANEIDIRNIDGQYSSLDVTAIWIKSIFSQAESDGSLFEDHYKTTNGIEVIGSHGVAIYYPTDVPSSDYAYLPFAKNNLWWRFIKGETTLPNEPLLLYRSHSETKSGSDTVQAGDTVETKLWVANYSANTATQVYASISTDDPYITILTPGPISYPDISSLDSVQSNSPYSFAIADTAPNGHRFSFRINIEAQGGAYTNTASFGLVVKGTVGIEEVAKSRSTKFALYQSHPNPFIASTAIHYTIPKSTHIVLKISDITGRIIKTLVNKDVKPGYYTTRWDGRNGNGKKLASGIYFIRFQAGNFKQTRKMILVR